MLQIQCNCGWSGRAESKEALLEVVEAHVNELHPEEQRDEGLLRAMIAQLAHPVGVGGRVA